MSVNYDRVCRLCLSSRGELLPIFPTTSSDDSEPLVLAVKINDCVSVQINENDELPTNVCRKCMDNVNNWHIFKSVCERTQNKLQSLINNESSHLEEIHIKTEPNEGLSDGGYDDGVVINGSYPDDETAASSSKIQPEGPPILASLGLTPRSDKKNIDPRMDWQRVHAILDIIKDDEVIDSLQSTEEYEFSHISDHDSDIETELKVEIPAAYRDSKTGYICKNKIVLSKLPKLSLAENIGKIKEVSQLRKRNIHTNGVKCYPRPRDAWQMLMSDDLLELISTSTNEHISKFNNLPTTMKEIKTLIGILYYQGIMRPTHEKCSDLWDFGPICIQRAMKYQRFKVLLENIRFDTENNSGMMQLDIMKRIRKVFEIFAMNCRTSMEIGNIAVIDETLLPVQGPCPLKYSIKNKKIKNGIKVVLLVDPNNFYISNLDVISDSYFGREDIAIKLVQHLGGSGRIIIMDSWFTSINLIDTLRKEYSLFSIAALNPNDETIPPIFLSSYRKCKPVLNGFIDDDTVLTSFVNANSKIGNILSNDPSHYKRSPAHTVVSEYKRYKSTVEVVDVLMHYYTTMQNTNDWTLSLFFMLLNIASVNAQVLWSVSNSSAVSNRRKFIRELASSLLETIDVGQDSSELFALKRPRLNPGVESDKDEEEMEMEDEEMNEDQAFNAPNVPEVSITVMRPSGETLHARQGIQQLASKDCLVCGRSYRYSHNARRHELTAHSFDRYTNKITAKKSHNRMQPKLRPNPFNPKARLMPNPISHKMQLQLPQLQQSIKLMPKKIIPPKPIPIRSLKPSQNSLPYPLRIKALKDLQIKKKEPQILKTLLTTKPEVLVSEPEIINSGPESPETLISEPEIASFQVETILSEPDGFINQDDADKEDDVQNHNQNYDTVDMDSENEIEIARQPDNEEETEVRPENEAEENYNEEENAGDEQQNDLGKENDGIDESQEKVSEEHHEDGEEDAKEPEEVDKDVDDSQENYEYDQDGDPPIAPVVEINEDIQNSYNSEAIENEEEELEDYTADDGGDGEEEAKELDPDKQYVTKTQREFILKYRDIIEQINTQRCLCCDREHPRRKAVIQHLQKNGHKVPKHTCYNCVVTFSHIGALLSHMRSNSCTDLWKIIYKEGGITDDQVIDDEPKVKVQYKDILNARSYACKLCPAKFQLKQLIMKHVLDVHEDGQSHVVLACVHCGSRFKDKSIWKKHIRNGECTVYIACDLCTEKFGNVQDFNEHAVAVHAGNFDPDSQSKCIDGRPTDCPICDKKCCSYQALVKHLKAIHNEETPHYCQHCEAKFEHAADLDKHTYTEHSLKMLGTHASEPDMSLVKEEAEEYHYSCTECNAIFETVDAWTDHQVAEHNQVAHHCDQCEKKFLRPSELAEHKNSHLRVKFYPCSLCGNSYSSPQKLSQHVQQTHPGSSTIGAGDTDFFCDICVRTFKSRQAFSNHMRIHAKVPSNKKRPGDSRSFAPQIIGKPIHFSMIQPGFSPFKPNCNVPNAPYSCDICGKGFMHKKNIWKHKKVLHADLLNDRHDSEENTMHASTEEDEYNPDENGAILSTPQFNSFNFANMTNSMQSTPQEPMQFSCELCYKRFPLKTSLWKHKRAKHGIINPSATDTSVEVNNSRSSCTICKISFADKKSYYRHRKNVHKSTVQMCKICGKPLNSTLELYEHLKSDHARELLGYNSSQGPGKSQEMTQEVEVEFEERETERPDPNAEYQARYPCDTCGKQFVGLLALQNHQCINQLPQQPQTFDCEICHKSYISIAALKSHRGWHLRSPDGKAAANNSGLWMPQNKVTSKVSKYEVVDASQLARVSHTTTSAPSPLTKRRLPPEVEVTVVNPNKKLRSDDSGEMDQSTNASGPSDDRYCRICDREFTKRAAYQRHMDEVHQPNSVFCPVCDKSFTRKSTLIVHMKKHYDAGEGGSANLQDEEVSACEVCGERFDDADALNAHRETQHGDEESAGDSEDDGSAPPAQPGEFTCAQCGDGVATPRDLIAHRTMHATPTKFFCNICKVYFARAIDLSSHTRARHSDNEKVFFPCAMCDRFYMNKKSLQRHIEMAH
ncbi:unnamed protein product [Pieris brassicae]|uniref:Uncharacterized protein n=1 Tax=Pieris brassicae TaxID=7116 RepID=A0A9P0TN08_PIEBR|nr:unnamed protein product [Pieris brassicae]